MNVPRLLVILLAFSFSITKAQRTFYPSELYYKLISSEDKVFYYDQKKWELVLCDETLLLGKTKIKTNAPFSVINSKKVFFCPEAKTAHTLNELIRLGGKRNTSRERTATSALIIDPLGKTTRAASMDPSPDRERTRKLRFNYLLYNMNDDNTNTKVLSQDINNKVKADSTMIIGYNKVLISNKERTKESLLSSIKTMRDSIRGNIFLIYISADGIKDQNGDYHFFASDSKYDSLNCEFINTLTIDSLSEYVNKLNRWGTSVFVIINTNHPIDLIQGMYHMKKGFVYIWDPNSGKDKNTPPSLYDVLSPFNKYQYDYLDFTVGDPIYFINRKD